jgi:hypothetical protein
LTQEQEVNEQAENDEERSTEQEHHHEVRRASAERAFLQHAAIAVSEDHVEEKVESDRPEEEKSREQPPYLEVPPNKYRVEVELERRYHVQLNR